MIGNYYFENAPERATYAEAATVRALLRRADVPIVWLSGHVHWNSMAIVDAVPHITLQSLSETWTSMPAPAVSWGLLELGRDDPLDRLWMEWTDCLIRRAVPAQSVEDSTGEEGFPSKTAH